MLIISSLNEAMMKGINSVATGFNRSGVGPSNMDPRAKRAASRRHQSRLVA